MFTSGRRMMVVLTAAAVVSMGALNGASAGAWAGPDDPKAPPVPAKQVYDEKADAKAQIAAALKAAKRDNTRVLIQWGGNWCGWCIKLNQTCKTDKDIARELLYEYVVVHVDAGKPAGKNMDLAASYGATPDKDGFPFLTVLDASGKPIANQETGALEEKDAAKGEPTGKHDAAAVLAFLKKNHVDSPLDASRQLDEALAMAKKEDKKVFLHFGAPWCGWCHRLEDWMAKPDVAAVLAKDFVDLKIDMDRATGAKDVLMRFTKNDKGGIPWFVFLDSSGAPIMTSDGPKGNVGFPAAAEEVAHFEAMLTKAAKHMTAAEVKGLAEGLREKK